VLRGSGRLQCGGRAQGGLKGPIKGEAGDLGVRALVGIAAMIRAGEADRATTRHDPSSGKEASGRRARTGGWPVGSCLSAGWSGATSSDGTAGRNRGSQLGEEDGKEGGGADRWARAVRERGKWGAAKEWRGQLVCASWADRGVEGRTGRLAGLGGKRRAARAGLEAGLAFLLSFSFLFSNSNSNLLNSNKFESNSNHAIK
jgi:hypothetical protein